MKTGYKVTVAMTKSPITTTPENVLSDCAKQMESKHVGGLLIIDNEKLKGVITEQDIVRKAIAKGKDPKNTKVRDVMETKVITISPDKDIYDALVMMRDNNIRHLPVLHKNEMLGLLTIKDILKIEPQLFDLIAEKFELREERRKPIRNIGENEGICETCGEYTSKLIDVDGSMMCSDCAENA